MVKYYELSNEYEPSIIGVTDGVSQAYIDEKFVERNLWYKNIFFENIKVTKDWWKIWANLSQYGGETHEVFMGEKAIHTDFIGGLLRGFFVNDKLKSILETAHLPRHKFFKATFNQEGKTVDGYWWFIYDLDDGSETVDFEKSEFDLDYHFKTFNKHFTIKTYHNYISAFYETGAAIKATKLVFKENFNKQLDIWGCQFLSLRGAYISENLLKKFQEHKIVGYRIREPKCPLVFE